MFCVRREDRESEWITFLAGEQEAVYGVSRIPSPWSLFDVINYVREHRTSDNPVAAYKVEGKGKKRTERLIYPLHVASAAMAEMERRRNA